MALDQVYRPKRYRLHKAQSKRWWLNFHADNLHPGTRNEPVRSCQVFIGL